MPERVQPGEDLQTANATHLFPAIVLQWCFLSALSCQIGFALQPIAMNPAFSMLWSGPFTGTGTVGSSVHSK